MIHVLSRLLEALWGTSCKHVWQTKPIYIFQYILDYPAPQTRLNSNKLMNLWNQELMGSWWILLQELMRQEPITNRLLIRVKLFLVNFYELSALILLAFLPTCRMRFFFAFKSIFLTVLQYLTIFPCVTHLIKAGATHYPMFYWPRWKNLVSYSLNLRRCYMINRSKSRKRKPELKC